MTPVPVFDCKVQQEWLFLMHPYPDATQLPLLFERTIIAILILSLTGLSTAWAFDAHAADVLMHEHAEEHPGSDASQDEAMHGCDHHCHAGAHLIGLGYMPRAVSEGNCFVIRLASPASILISRSTAPPLKPPQS